MNLVQMADGSLFGETLPYRTKNYSYKITIYIIYIIYIVKFLLKDYWCF